jgi:hypothetical protein
MFEEVFDLLDTNSSIGEVTYIACMVVAWFGWKMHTFFEVIPVSICSTHNSTIGYFYVIIVQDNFSQ